MSLFNRVFQITIGEDNETSTQGLSSGGITDDGIAIPSDITGKMNANFSVIKNQTSDTKPSNFVEIYNLQDITQTFIKEKGKRLRIIAGYRDNFSQIYDGTVTKVNIKKQGTDVITRIELGNKTFHLTDAIFNKSYIGNISIKNIITDAVDSFIADGIPLKVQYLSLLPDEELSHFAFDGRTKDLLDNLLKPRKIQWFIDGDVLKFSLIGTANVQEVFTLSYKNGIIEAPTKTDKGVIVKTLLDGRLVVSDVVEIDTGTGATMQDGRQTSNLKQEYQGQYKIFSIHHHGNSLSGSFLTEAECIPL